MGRGTINGLGPAAVVLAAAVVVVLAAAPASASLPRGKAYAPPDGRALQGVSDTGDADDLFAFADQVRAHPAVLRDFYDWRVPLTTGALYRWGVTDTRGVLSLSTAPGGGRR